LVFSPTENSFDFLNTLVATVSGTLGRSTTNVWSASAEPDTTPPRDLTLISAYLNSYLKLVFYAGFILTNTEKEALYFDFLLDSKDNR
jgi:hypothetical protein